jgi:inner membrane protein
MENLAHTLLGLSLAKSGLERATPLATTALVISSNLPDLDVLSRIEGGTVGYLEYHRGFTHGFVGLAVLAAGLTGLLMFVDRRFRLRRDPFRRPLRPVRIFWIAYLGGLGHAFMDFTNSYGVRPLLPFSNRWFYGDLAFVVDPWIWLILGAALVWLTATSATRTVVWLVIGSLASFAVALALRHPYDPQTIAIPSSVRAIWFGGLAIVIAGALFRWRRVGPRLVRYSLLLLALYYGGTWMAHQSALQAARISLTSLRPEGAASMAAWPAPANPLFWQSAAKSSDAIYDGSVNLLERREQWRELPGLDPKLADALRQSRDARVFLDFMRYGTANVEQRGDGTTVLALHELRFDLRMRVELDREMTVTYSEVRWF